MSKKNKIILFLASIPPFTFLIAVLGSVDGVYDCFFCHHPVMIYGVDAMIYKGGLLIILFYPIYVLSFVLIFKEVYKIRCKNIKKSILCLITGSVSLIFSILFVFCKVFVFDSSLKSSFFDVCIYHPFILLCNIVSFIYLIRFVFLRFCESRTR